MQLVFSNLKNFYEKKYKTSQKSINFILFSNFSVTMCKDHFDSFNFDLLDELFFLFQTSRTNWYSAIEKTKTIGTFIKIKEKF